MNNKEQLRIELESFFANPSTRNKKYGFADIRRRFSGSLGYRTSDLKELLIELEQEGIIYRDEKHDLYRFFPHDLNYAQGTIKINKHGEGFLIFNDKKYKVNTDDLNDALDGDTVVLTPTKKVHNGHIIAKVDKIIKRKDGLIVCEVTSKDGEMFLKPFNAFLKHPIKINAYSMKALVEGERILVKIDTLENSGVYYAGFVKSIGHKDDPDADLKMIAIENSIVVDFSEQALKEADRIPTTVSRGETVGRTDYRDKVTFSIDGAKTKDRDDALSIEKNSKGNYVLYVHIADVSHYIKPGMALWDEAMTRGTSVYMADTVIPMIPHKLSNGICSLNPGEDRLTFTCVLEVSPQGEVLNYDFIDGVINSKKAMVYDDVNECLENGNWSDDYIEFADDLTMLQELSAVLEKAKVRRGYVDLGSSDIEIERDEMGNPIKFVPKVQKTAEKIIENCMLIAGEAAANYLAIPTPLRVHEAPEEETMEETFDLLQRSGIKVKSTHDVVNGHVIQQLLKQIKDADERQIAATIILRSMKRARYDVENVGHFGLGLQKYGQFTSPIRRAPDLRIHHNIRLQRDNKFNYAILDAFESEVDEFAKHATYKERKADEAEREALQFEMIKYMAEHIGEKFEARVTYVNSRGIYIKTPDGIEGKLLAEDIEGDTFIYDDSTCSFKGKKSKLKIKIGTRLLLTCIDTKKEYKTVNFGLETEDLAAMKLAKKM